MFRSSILTPGILSITWYPANPSVMHVMEVDVDIGRWIIQLHIYYFSM